VKARLEKIQPKKPTPLAYLNDGNSAGAFGRQSLFSALIRIRSPRPLASGCGRHEFGRRL